MESWENKAICLLVAKKKSLFPFNIFIVTKVCSYYGKAKNYYLIIK